MSSLKKVCIVAGARPNFMKIAPIIRELKKRPTHFEWKLVHTGQHYDKDMSDVFFDELGIPKPHFHLECGGGSHAEQTARIMSRFEAVCLEICPDLVLVVGDVNSTMACSIVAKKLSVRVAHVEAGLRSGDMTMPEEINRRVTDAISDDFFVTEPSGVENLRREGVDADKIHFVGHVMIDNLFFQLAKLREDSSGAFATAELKARLATYGIITLHRPSNVDDRERLQAILGALSRISENVPLIFPIHPRTAARISDFGIKLPSSIFVTNPLGYMEFLNLWSDAKVVFTDSGGLQEETTALGVPCITLRENTERPVTVDQGTNILVGSDPYRIQAAFETVMARGDQQVNVRPEFWDGFAAKRIVDKLSIQ